MTQITLKVWSLMQSQTFWSVKSSGPQKSTGNDGIPAELFKILKDDAIKVLHSLCQQIWKTQQWPQDWKKSVFIPIPKKGSTDECSNFCPIAFTSHASEVMFKILQRLQQYLNREISDIQAWFRQRKQRTNCQHSLDQRKQGNFGKASTSVSLTTQKPLTV